MHLGPSAHVGAVPRGVCSIVLHQYCIKLAAVQCAQCSSTTPHLLGCVQGHVQSHPASAMHLYSSQHLATGTHTPTPTRTCCTCLYTCLLPMCCVRVASGHVFIVKNTIVGMMSSCNLREEADSYDDFNKHLQLIVQQHTHALSPRCCSAPGGPVPHITTMWRVITYNYISTILYLLYLIYLFIYNHTRAPPPPGAA